MFDCKLGYVVKLRGFKGEIVVETRFKNVEFLRGLKQVSIENVVYEIEEFKNLQHRTGLKLKNINDEQTAKKYLRKEVFYSKEQVEFNQNLELEDMINFELIDENGFVYGRLEEIENYGAGNILFVKNGEKEIVLPQNKGFIKNYELKKQQIIVDSKLIKEVL